MAYLVLARKYRPQRFSDVIGQDHVTHTLMNALQQGRIAHGYIFSGHRGIGKTTIARILAMALNCRVAIGSAQRPDAEPCGICESCTEVRAGNAVDVIETDAATNRGIDEIRELRDAARYRPARDKYKIYILDEAHQITDAAFNALLKTLEEPPDHVIFMMATTQPEDIPQTIRSRCQHYSFHAVRFDDIVGQLRSIAQQEQINANEDALALLAEAGDGSMRDALSIMDQAIASAPTTGGATSLEAPAIRELMGSVPNSVFERLLEAVSANLSSDVLLETNRLLDSGHSPQQLARQLVRYLRNCLVARLAGESSQLLQISPDERARAVRTAMLFGEEDLTRFLQVMLRTFDELNYRQEQRLHLELGLLKLVHLQRLLPLEQILSGTPGASPKSASPRNIPAAASLAEPRAQPSPRPSPFEQDRSRKLSQSTEEISTSPAEDSTPAPAALAPNATSRELPDPGVARTPANTRINAAGATSATEYPVANASAQPRSPEPAGEHPDVDSLRRAVVDALANRGHATASTLLNDAAWRMEGTTLQVQMAVQKTMLGLVFNAEAEKIARDALRQAGGQSLKLALIPLAPGEAAPPAKQAARAVAAGREGSSAGAVDHPVVQQARDLFRAEVRSVVDLREKS